MPVGIRTHAKDQSRGRARPLAAMLDDLFCGRWRERRAGGRQERRHRRVSGGAARETFRSSRHNLSRARAGPENGIAWAQWAAISVGGFRHATNHGAVLSAMRNAKTRLFLERGGSTPHWISKTAGGSEILGQFKLKAVSSHRTPKRFFAALCLCLFAASQLWGSEKPVEYTFRNHVQPILAKAGC